MNRVFVIVSSLTGLAENVQKLYKETSSRMKRGYLYRTFRLEKKW